MPPRSYYNSPKAEDYIAFARAFFPADIETASLFANATGRPYIAGDVHFAAYLGVASSLVRQIFYRKNYHYRTFSIKKGDGTDRIIKTPKTYLKVMQWWINDNILSSAELSDDIHGFRKGRSYITNALTHLDAKHILNVDISQFFPSITEEMVAAVFRGLGYSDAGANLLAGLTTLNGVTPTGAPTSPLLGNLILREFDGEMAKVSTATKIKYTRYADDLTFSSQERIDGDFLKVVSEHVERSGFVLNNRKTRFLGKGDRMDVTGIGINAGANLPIEWRNWARGYVQRAIRY